MTSYIGFDTKELERRDPIDEMKGFYSLIGASVHTADYKKTCKTYDKVLKECLESLELETPRRILGHSDLRKLIGVDATLQVEEKIINEMLTVIIGSRIYLMMIPPSKVPNIFMYKFEPRHRQSCLVPKDFMKYINPGFSHLCAWKYCD